MQKALRQSRYTKSSANSFNGPDGRINQKNRKDGREDKENMNTQLIDSLVTTATDIVLIVGLLSPLLVQALRFAKAHTANKRVQLLESYAERVVLSVEQQRNLLPSDKKKLATKRLADYVNKSKLNLQVTDQQISDLIESAVNSLKDENSRGTVVKSTAVAPAKPAETATEPAKPAETATEPSAEVPSANEILK